MDLSHYVSVPEAAKELNLTRQWTHKMAVQGYLPGCRKVGGRWLVPKISIAGRLAQQELRERRKADGQEAHR